MEAEVVLGDTYQLKAAAGAGVKAVAIAERASGRGSLPASGENKRALSWDFSWVFASHSWAVGAHRAVR
jgi:hypothetical protein